MRKWTIPAACCIICLLLGGFAYLLNPAWHFRPTQVTAVTCPGASTPAVGAPAIHPRNNCTPSFTEDDVHAYLQNGVGLGRMGTMTDATITEILFTTSKDASGLMGGESTGLPDDAVVCYVELRGDLAAQSVTFLAPPHANQHPTAVVTAHIVFDAHTGNELVVGTSS